MFRLAIIIPYFKIDFFEKTLSSLAQQTDQRFNVYIGDDASPDSPVELLEKYKGKFNFTYQKFEKNLGSISLTKQWERCIEMMRDEEWLMILGDDDVLGDNVVEEFYKNLQEIEIYSNVVKFSTRLINDESLPISEIFKHKKYELPQIFFVNKNLDLTRSSLSEHVFRKSMYLKHRFKNYDLAWPSDDMAILCFSENKPIFAINESVVFIRMSSLNISNNKNLIERKLISKTKSLIDVLFDFGFSKDQKKILADIIENNIFNINDVPTILYIRYVIVKFKIFGLLSSLKIINSFFRKKK